MELLPAHSASGGTTRRVSKQPIRTRYLGHVTGYQPISGQYFLIRSVLGSFSAARSDAGSQQKPSTTCSATTNARRSSRVKRLKTFQKMKRARRENRAILMSFLVSLSYLLCYMEIINFYITAILDMTIPSLPDVAWERLEMEWSGGERLMGLVLVVPSQGDMHVQIALLCSVDMREYSVAMRGEHCYGDFLLC
eukprot:sb/3470958/